MKGTYLLQTSFWTTLMGIYYHEQTVELLTRNTFFIIVIFMNIVNLSLSSRCEGLNSLLKLLINLIEPSRGSWIDSLDRVSNKSLVVNSSRLLSE